MTRYEIVTFWIIRDENKEPAQVFGLFDRLKNRMVEAVSDDYIGVVCHMDRLNPYGEETA